jgi:hypothetical protein
MLAIRTVVLSMVSTVAGTVAGAGGAGCAGNAAFDGAAPASGDAGAGAPASCLSSNECPTGFTCNEFHVCVAPSPTSDGGVPAETEIALGAPISSQRYIYVAMTAQNKLARIDGETLAVASTPVGAAPREVATIPGSDGALVLDTANGTATVVRPVLTGGDGTRVLATLPSLNRIDVDPTGRFAVVWFDLIKAAHDHTGNAGSFQDACVIALAPGREKAVALTVGFRPRSVAFDAAGTRAYVITQDGVSVIDLAFATEHEPRIVPPIAVAAPGTSPDDLEVQIVATGDYAAVRQAGHSGLRVVSMRTDTARQSWDIPLAAPSGRRQLLAATPNTGEIVVIDADTAQFRSIPVADPIGRILVFPGATDASPDTPPHTALFASVGAHLPRLYTLTLDHLGDPLTRPALVPITLDKPVRDVVAVPGKDLAMIVHDDARTVLGVVDLATGTTAPLLGVGKLDAYDFSPTGSHLIGATTGVARVGFVALDNLHPTDFRLDDPPAHVLATANGKIFVDHADPFGHATIIPSPTAERKDAVVLSGFLTTDLLDEEP